MKHYDCLVPGCSWHTEAKDEAEVLSRAVDHLRDVHDESVVRPEMVNRIKERIRDSAPPR